MEGKIAFEEHFSNAENNKFWDAKGEEARNGKAFSQDIARRLMDPSACLKEMDRAGIEMCILSLTSPGVQSVIDPKAALDLARASNDYVYSLTKAHPDRFRGFASVPLQDPKAAAAELKRAVTELGLKGALINGFSNIGENEKVRYLDDEPCWEFWDQVALLDVPVYLHPREPLPSQRRAIQGYPELVGSAWGFGIETSAHAVRLLLSGLFDAYPNLQIILGHLGEGLLFLLPRLQHRLDEQREGEKGGKALHRPSYYFSRNFYLTTSGHFHARQLREAIAQIGVERVLFSTDYPYEQMDAGARWFDDLVLETSFKATIGRENANRLFHLNLPSLTDSTVLGAAS